MKSEKIFVFMEIFPVFRYLCCLLPHRVKVNIIYNKVNINNYY